jgi:TolB-like protein
MTLSTNYLNKALILILSGVFFFSVLANAKEIKTETPPSGHTKFCIAVFPVENISGTAAPLKEIRQIVIEKLKANRFDVLDEGTLEVFMAKHRIRYTGGIDREVAKAFKQEVGTDGVLITTLELFDDTNPPKISLIARLVSTGENPSILWMDGAGLAGDDSRGLLDLGLIEDPKILLDKAMKIILDSLTSYFSTKTEAEEGNRLKRKFRPKVAYRSPELGPERKYVVAVLPFFNLSERKYAGEILVLHFIRELRKFNNFEIIEPGILRQELLGLRVIMEDGVSLANADTIFSSLDADVIVSGKVIYYEDYQGGGGRPKVNFSTVFIERKSRKVVWGSNSYNEGDDGVFFFDRGRVNTAYAMSSQMVRWIGEKLLGDHQRVQGGKRNGKKGKGTE